MISFGVRRYTSVAALVGLMVTAAGCDWSDQKVPSVILIAVESLAADSVTCTEDSEVARNSGISQLCNESVRFTHAYTTSVLGAPALSSVLTGLLPAETGVRTNGQNFLSAKFPTVAEAAVSQGYRTAFFSGGPAVLRRHGFAQGFEVFDDNILSSLPSPYRTASEVLGLASEWIQDEVGKAPFFAALYLADLDFYSRPTTTDLGEQRPRGSKSQLQEVDESLASFLSHLRKSKRWDETLIVLVGLNGLSPEERVDEVPGMNLFFENTQVALLIKPATKKRDLGKKWKVDQNVSLVDIGATLFETFKSALPQSELFGGQSLRSSWESGQLDLDSNRKIVIESSWGSWLGLTSTRFALVKGHLFALFDQVPRVFNTLVDRLQMSPMSLSDSSVQEILKVPESYLSLGLGSGVLNLSRELFELYRLGRRIWGSMDPAAANLELEEFLAVYPENPTAVGWAALRALQDEDWNRLLGISKNSNRSDWAFVALKNLGEEAYPPEDPCWRIYLGQGSDWESCRNEDSRALLQFLKEKAEGASFSTFLRREWQRIWARRLEQYNWASGYLWDVRKRGIEPHFVDLVLALKENRKWSLWTRARLQQKIEEPQ